jgi:hypothetical protein
MPDLFWVEREWRGDDLKIEVRESSPLRLHDPATLREMVRPRMSLLRLIGLFFASLIARSLDAGVRQRIRRLLRRSYL